MVWVSAMMEKRANLEIDAVRVDLAAKISSLREMVESAGVWITAD